MWSEAPAETSFTEAGSEVPSAAVSADGSIGEAPGIDLLSERRIMHRPKKETFSTWLQGRGLKETENYLSNMSIFQLS